MKNLSITQEIAEFVVESSIDSIPYDVQERAKYFLLDWLGVTIGGSTCESGIPIYNMIKKFSTSGKSTVFGKSYFSQAVWASLGNGASAHCLEQDDTFYGGMLHPSCVVISTAVAVAEEIEASGINLIEAIVVGYEVVSRLALAQVDACDERGFHPTGICGVFGAAAAAGKLLKFNTDQMSNALGIAAHQASGINEYQKSGAWTKRLHPGWSSHAGIVAANLAVDNFLAEKSSLEGEFGFFHAYSNKYDLSSITKDLGSDYFIMKSAIKPYSCCARMHTAIDSFLKIIKENQLVSNDIESITVAINSINSAFLNHPRELKKNPGTTVEAQFSVPYAIAVSLLYGTASIEQYTNKVLNNEKVKNIMAKVELVADKSMDLIYPEVWSANVSVKTTDGNLFENNVKYPTGSPENLMSWKELYEKYFSLANSVYPEEQLKEIYNEVRKLELCKSVSDLSSVWSKQLSV